MKKFDHACELLYNETSRRVGHSPNADEMHRLFPVIVGQFPVLRRIAGVMGHPAMQKANNEIAALDEGGPMRKGQTTMDGIATPKRKRTKAERRARKAVGKAQWKALPKDVRKVLVADVENALALEKIQKRLGGGTAATPAATGTGTDAALAKVVLPHAPDAAAAASAIEAIKTALGRGRPGAGGWR